MFASQRLTNVLSAPKITDKFLRYLSSDHCSLAELDLSKISYEYIEAEVKFEQKMGSDTLIQKGITPISTRESLQTYPPDLEQFKKISEAIKKNNSLKVLNLGDLFHIDQAEDYFSSLIDVIKNNRSIKKIVLDGWVFSSAQMNRLMTVLRSSDILQISLQRCKFDDLGKIKELIETCKKHDNFKLDLSNSNISALLSHSLPRMKITFQLLRKKYSEEIIFDKKTIDLLNLFHEKRMTYPLKEEKEFKSSLVLAAKYMIFDDRTSDEKKKTNSHKNTYKRKTL